MVVLAIFGLVILFTPVIQVLASFILNGVSIWKNLHWRMNPLQYFWNNYLDISLAFIIVLFEMFSKDEVGSPNLWLCSIMQLYTIFVLWFTRRDAQETTGNVFKVTRYVITIISLLQVGFMIFTLLK